MFNQQFTAEQFLAASHCLFFGRESLCRTAWEGWQRDRPDAGWRPFIEHQLDIKNLHAEAIVQQLSWAGAINGLNPFIGGDIVIDGALMAYMNKRLLTLYGLDKGGLVKGLTQEQRLGQVLMHATRDFVGPFLKKQAKRMMLRSGGRTVVKFVPLLGFLVAAGVGYGTYRTFAKRLVSACQGTVRQMACGVVPDSQVDILL